jgi:hypothetical protein
MRPPVPMTTRALVAIHFAGEDAEERGLARAVGAQKAHPLPLVDLEGEPVQYVFSDFKGLYKSLRLNLDHLLSCSTSHSKCMA